MEHNKAIVFARLRTSLGKPQPKTIKVLLDSGASETIIKQELVSKLCHRKLNQSIKWTTAAGPIATNATCKIQFTLPELHEQRLIEWNTHVSNMQGRYDMIIGDDLLSELGIDLLYSRQVIQWDIAEIPMKHLEAIEQESFHIDDPAPVQDASMRIKSILDAKYEKADLALITKSCTHLKEEEQKKLHQFLSKYEDLFDGTLGHWKNSEYEIELKENVKPHHSCAYSIPKIHECTLCYEVERLVQVGVLQEVNNSEWAAPTFIIPKKDGTVRFISDFRELNKRIKRKPFPIPNIQDLLLKLEGFMFATSLDLNMGYYHIELSPFSRQLCTIILPWGKYEYQRLPMGLCNSPDIFQEKMSNLMSDIEYVRTYIDDLLILTKSDWDDHLEKLEKVLIQLQKAGLKINARKSFFGHSELEYLGYWVTRSGIQPMSKK